jgi:hypothetical protein
MKYKQFVVPAFANVGFNYIGFPGKGGGKGRDGITGDVCPGFSPMSRDFNRVHVDTPG